MCSHATQRGRPQGSDIRRLPPPLPTPHPSAGTAPPSSAPPTSDRGTEMGGGGHRDTRFPCCVSNFSKNCSVHFLPSVTTLLITDPSNLSVPTVRRCTHPSTTNTRAGDAASLGLGEGAVGEDRNSQCKLRGTREAWTPAAREPWGRQTRREGWNRAGRTARRAWAPPTLRSRWTRAAAGSP